MVAVTDVINSLFTGLEMFVPVGVTPLVFYSVFLLIFAIVNTTTRDLKILGDIGDNRIRTVVSVAVAYFTATSAFATVLIANLFPNVGILLIFGIFAMVVTTFIAPNSGEAAPLRGMSKALMVILFGWMIWNAWSVASLEVLGFSPEIIEVNPQDWPQIILFVLIAIGFYYMFFGGREGDSDNRWLMAFKPPWSEK